MEIDSTCGFPGWESETQVFPMKSISTSKIDVTMRICLHATALQSPFEVSYTITSREKQKFF